MLFSGHYILTNHKEVIMKFTVQLHRHSLMLCLKGSSKTWPYLQAVHWRRKGEESYLVISLIFPIICQPNFASGEGNSISHGQYSLNIPSQNYFYKNSKYHLLASVNISITLYISNLAIKEYFMNNNCRIWTKCMK